MHEYLPFAERSVVAESGAGVGAALAVAVVVVALASATLFAASIDVLQVCDVKLVFDTAL